MTLLFIAGIVVVLILGVALLIKSLGETTLEKVNTYIRMKDFYRARMFLEKVMKSNPKEFLPYWCGATIYYELKEYEKALENLKAILNMPDAFKELNRAQFHLMMADVFYKLDKPNSALNEYLLVTQYQPGNSLAYSRVGQVFFHQRDNDNALKFLFQAVKYDPKDHYSFYLMGRIYYYMDLYEKAREYLKECIKLNSKFLQPYYYLAQIEFADHLFQNAIKYAGKELKKEGSDKWSKLLFLTARCYQGLENYKHALKFFEMITDEIPSEHPMRKEISYHMGECYLKLNKIDQATAIWEQLYYMDPKYKDIAEKYAQFSDINRETIIKDILSSDREKTEEIFDPVLKKLGLRRDDLKFDFEYIIKISATESSKAYLYNVMVYINRSFETITQEMLEIFLQELRTTNYHKGVYISLAEFTSNAEIYASKYPIDLIDRIKLLELLK
ncbi:MAG: tetratricopeptide repeat protein [Spirochaetes bacterium]|nr:tetratricopeptide repeat protein [Spirochaetota bacterium]